MTELRTILADTIVPVRLDGRRHGHAPVKATPWISEVGSPDVGDGVIVYDADCTLDIQHIRGWAARLTLREPPAFDRLQAMVVGGKAKCCYGGVLIETSDINLSWPRVCSFRDTGIWMRGGNCHVVGGHVYGGGTAVKIGGDPERSGHCTLTGVQFSDAKIGCEILAPATLTGCLTQHCFSTGLLVGAKARIINQDVWCYPGSHGDATGMVGVELQWGNGRNGSWSVFDGAVTVGDGGTGIVLDADQCVITADVCGRGAKSVALRVRRAINQCRVVLDTTQCGGGVVIENLGVGNRLEFHGTGPLQLPAAGWSARGNKIWRNGDPVNEVAA